MGTFKHPLFGQGGECVYIQDSWHSTRGLACLAPTLALCPPLPQVPAKVG